MPPPHLLSSIKPHRALHISGRRLKSLLASRPKTVLAFVVVAALIFRVAIVITYHAPGGDGWQYYWLSQQLVGSGRFAYGPPPGPRAWSRLPGYPLFLAYVAVRNAALPMELHLQRATLWNAGIDVGTALLVWAMLRQRGAAATAQWIGFGLVIFSPLLTISSSYGLTESWTTFLVTLSMFCVTRAGGSRLYAWMVGAGVALGLAQLARVDAFTILPGALLLIFGTRSLPPLRRWSAVMLLGASAFAVWAPWPARNWRVFGALHAEGTEWLTQQGVPQPAGIMTWMRSWATGAPGEAYDLFVVANNAFLDVNRPGIVLPPMYDDAAEKARVVTLFQKYNREKLSAAVDAEFTAMGHQRAHDHPFRQYVVLPIKRLASLWTTTELPFRVPWLGLPAWINLYNAIDVALLILALAAVPVVWRYDRRFVLALLAVVVTRSLMHVTVAHPCPTKRYTVESVPLLLILVAWGAGVVVDRTRQRLGGSVSRERA